MSSSLDPDNLGNGPDRILGKGHGTRALGPSDTSDSGSDMQGGEPLLDEDLEYDTENVAELEGSGLSADLADALFDSDTDSRGTGERASVDRDRVVDGGDISADHVETVDGDWLDDEPPA